MWFDLPRHAQEVWSGELFKIYTWEQKLFNGETKIFETVVQEDAVLMIIVEDNKIVIAHEQQPHVEGTMCRLVWWRLPWGKDALTHAREELLEEAGMVSDQITLWWSEVRNEAHKRTWLFYIVRDAKVVSKQDLDPWGEKIDLVRLSFEEFVENVLHQWLWWLWLKCKIQEIIINKKLGAFRRYLFGSWG